MTPSLDCIVRALAVSLAFSGLACEPASQSTTSAYMSREDDRWLDHPIPVCFEQERGYDVDRALIQSVVSTEYARAGLYFKGWQTCNASDAGIRISFDENAAMSQTREFGRRNAGLTQNLVMGFKSRCGGVFPGSVCEANIALHEFGHALGLHHEMNRRDNNSCAQDQQDGEGEDALQLGPYDAQSIMNYCHLYAANDRLEALRLSDQDVAAVKAFTSGLIAGLDQLIPTVLHEPWTGYVAGSKLSAWRSVAGPKGVIACDQLSSYSSSQPMDQPVRLDPRDFEAKGDTIFTLCLLGEDASGQLQDPAVYSAIDFRVLSSSLVSDKAASQLIQQPHLYREGGSVILDVDVGASLPLRSLDASLVYSTSSIYRRIHNARFDSRDLGSGHYQLIFRAEDFPANGDVYVSTLELATILGDRLSLFSSAAWTPFYQSPWMSPGLTVTWAQDNDEKAPELLRMDGFPRELDAGGRFSFFMDITESSQLHNIRMMLRSGPYSLEPVVTWKKVEGTSFRVTLEIPQRSINGEYHLDTIYLVDIMDNSRYYSRDEASNRFDGTGLEAPLVKIRNGLSPEGNAPQLKSLMFTASRATHRDPVFLDVRIDDESSIKQLAVTLRHTSDQGFYKTIYGLDRGEIAGQRRVELNISPQHPLGEYAIQEIAITDRFGNTSRYERDPANPWNFVHGVAAPRLEIIE